MKRTIRYSILRGTLSIIFTIILSTTFAKGQEASQKEKLGWAEGWRYAFSNEGIQNWKPEFTLRYYIGFFSEGAKLSGGVKVDDKRTFSVHLEYVDSYHFYTAYHVSESVYLYGLGINFRRYWHLDKKKIIALYSDIYGGGMYVYNIPKDYYIDPQTKEKVKFIFLNKGDILGVAGWQPGIRIKFYKNMHIFGGLTIATNCLGFHAGIGF